MVSFMIFTASVRSILDTTMYCGLFYILTKMISTSCINIIYFVVYIYENMVDIDTPIREYIHQC
jgi:hypothetical protein